MEPGEFDDLQGFGKTSGTSAASTNRTGGSRSVERGQIRVLPPALQVRKDDAEFDDRLDRMATAAEVRREVEDFNEQVRAGFYQPTGGPPMITRQRDVETEVAAWRHRREELLRAQQEKAAAEPAVRCRKGVVPASSLSASVAPEGSFRGCVADAQVVLDAGDQIGNVVVSGSAGVT
jgi:hypothetical protein